MNKKKPLAKAGTSAKNTQVPAQKTAKKIAPVKAGKKGEVKVKATVSRTKIASGRKTSPVPQAKAAAAKSSPETKKLTKAPEGKKARGTVAASKTKLSPEKTVKGAAEKPGKGVARKTSVKAAPKAEPAPKKEREIAAEALKAKPKGKSAIKEAPSKIKKTTGEKLKPVEKPETTFAASQKGMKKKVKAPVLKGPKKTKEIQKKTAAMYAVHPRRERKPKRSFDLRVFLPEEELPEEEPQILPPSELPEEYGENELLLLEVDPSRVFASWEIKPEDIAGEAGKLILRVYDVTGIDSERIQGRRFFDIPISHRVASKFFDIKMPGRDVIMEIGLLHPEGSFKAIKRSHRVSMPELQTFEELGITGLLSDSETLIGY